MKLAVALDFVAPKLEGNMKVTKNEFSSYSVKCYGEDCDGNYIVLTADVEGNAHESDFDVFHIKVLENDIEKEYELSKEELIDIYCNGSVDASGVEYLEDGESMIFELF